MNPITYDAIVRPDGDAGTGYGAITGWAWTGYGATPEAALAALERCLQEVHRQACRPRRIVYELDL